MKRIIVSIANNFDQDRRMLRTADALQRHGYEVQIIGKETGQTMHRQTKIVAAHITCFFTNGFLFYLEFNLRLFFKLIATPSDILLSVDSDTLFANTLISKIKGKPLIIDMHELFTEVPELINRPIKKSIWRWIEKFGIAQSSKRYTVSQTIATEYEKRYGKAFEVVRNVPLAKEATQIKKTAETFTLAYIGALNKGRGIEQLIQAISKISDVDLMIYGTGDLDNELRSLTAELSMKDRVHFRGWTEPVVIHEHLRQTHVGVNLLDPSSQSYYLSLANKYFDYIHTELPIISMNFPEYQSLNSTHRTSILLDDLSEQQIINAIQQLKNNTELYTELTLNCRRAKEEWNWQNESKRLVSIFDF